MVREGAEESPAHFTTTGGELWLRSEDFDLYADMPCLLLPSSSACPVTTTEVVFELSVCLDLSVCLEISVCPELSACSKATIVVAGAHGAGSGLMVCVGSTHRFKPP